MAQIPRNGDPEVVRMDSLQFGGVHEAFILTLGILMEKIPNDRLPDIIAEGVAHVNPAGSKAFLKQLREGNVVKTAAKLKEPTKNTTVQKLLNAYGDHVAKWFRIGALSGVPMSKLQSMHIAHHTCHLRFLALLHYIVERDEVAMFEAAVEFNRTH